MLFSRSAFQHVCLACTRLATGFGVALGWLGGRMGVALGWLWGGFGVALGWLCTPESMPSICLQYGFAVALGGLSVRARDTFARGRILTRNECRCRFRTVARNVPRRLKESE